MYQNSKVIVTGGTSTYVAGNSNFHNGDLIVHNPESRPPSGFELLKQHVATGALHNFGEVSDQPKCHPGTRVAILDHLVGWAAALIYKHPIIWLHGPAGTGKSAILRTIAQMLFDRKLLVGSFFFFRTVAGRNSSDHFISTIAYQLALSIPATRPRIEEAIEENPLLFELSLWDQAQALIVSPILAIRDDPSFVSRQYPRIIIVDGLDECRDPDKQRDILQVLCRAIRSLPLPFAILVASRPEHHIRDAFGLGYLNTSSSRLSLDNSYEPDADIKNYLTDRFSAIRAKHPLKSCLPAFSWPSQRVVDQLVGKASGQFIYASTVDKFISSPRHNPAKRLDMILGALDAGTSKPFEQLDILYSTVFLNVDPVDLLGTLRILGVLLVPQKVLTKSQTRSPAFLERLLELEPGDVISLLFDLESLLTISGPDENIRFFHASLSDYLFDKSRSGQFWIDAEMVYADLAQQWLVHLPKSARWNDFRIFFLENDEIMSKASPTLGLHEAIQKFDLTKVPDPTMHIRPLFLRGIHNSKFSDAEELYRVQLAVYAQIIETKIRVYFQDIPLKYSLVTVVGHGAFENLRPLFDLSPTMVDDDRNHGFRILSSRLEQSLNFVLQDLLNDPKGRYYVDENQYGNIALHLMKCMTEDSGLYLSPDLRPSFGVKVFATTMVEIFPYFLSKSPARHELSEYITRHQLGQAYLKYSKIRDAIDIYILRSEAYNNSNHKILKLGSSEPKTPSFLNQTLETGGNTPGMVPEGVDSSNTNVDKMGRKQKGRKRWWKLFVSS